MLRYTTIQVSAELGQPLFSGNPYGGTIKRLSEYAHS